jgi:hypothetical protein
MQEFTVIPGSFKKIQKKVLWAMGPLMLIIITAALLIMGKSNPGQPNIMAYFIPFVCLVFGFGIYRGLKRQKVIFESYKLTIDKRTLLREQFNTPIIAIDYDSVTDIVKSKSGSFIIKGKNSNASIIIPAQIDNYNKLEEILNRIKLPTVMQSNNLWAKYAGYAGAIAVAALMLCVYTVNNKSVVGVAGVALVSIMVWSFYKIRINQNVNAKTKRSSLYIILVIVSVIAIVYSKLVA